MASLTRFRPLARSAALSRCFASSVSRYNTSPRPLTTSSLDEVPPPAAQDLAEAPVTAPPPPPPVLEPEPVEPTPVPRVRRPVGAFRGGLIGFLLGTTLVGGYGYFQLLDDYSQASSMLLLSVEELKASTAQMASHVERIAQVESDLTELRKGASTTKDIEGLRKEYRKLLESEHLHGVELRARVWGIEQDLHALSKHAGKSPVEMSLHLDSVQLNRAPRRRHAHDLTCRVAWVFARTRGLAFIAFMGKRDNNPALVSFAKALEKSCVELIDDHGIMTKDLALGIHGKNMKREHYVLTDGYLDALRDLMEKKLAKVVSGKL